MKTNAIITLAFAMSTPASFAALLAYDGMSGALTTEFNGSGGGTGWVSPWIASQSVNAGDFVYGAGLNYTDGNLNTLVTSGNSFLNQTSNINNPRNFNFGRTLTSSITTGEVYISVLYSEIAAGHDYFLQVDTGSGDVSALIARGSSGATTWNNESNVSMPGTTLPGVNETDFMVIGINLDTNMISVWDSPDLLAPGAADYTGGTAIDGVSGIKFFVKNENAESYAWDELRIGTTFADVAPVVPEPSSAALLGLGSLALILRRRK